MNDLDNADELDGLRHVLKPAQERVLAEVAAHPDEEFTRADYETLAHVSRSQAAYDLVELVKLGLVERFGSGRATRYRVVRGGAGRRRKWTSERIRTELSAFCDELGGWPRASEFKEAGRGDLYLAASRYGGIDHWAEELGYYEDEVPEPSEPEPGSGESELRRWVPLAGTGLATLAALAFLGLLLIGATGRHRSEAWPRPPLWKGTTRPPGRSPNAAAHPTGPESSCSSSRQAVTPRWWCGVARPTGGSCGRGSSNEANQSASAGGCGSSSERRATSSRA